MKEKLDTVRIDSMAYGGSGVGRIEGKVVFVPLTAAGDLASFRPIREKKGYLEGELVELIEPSPLRREPPCRHFGVCGGCSWQHIPYEEQAKAKEEVSHIKSKLMVLPEETRVYPGHGESTTIGFEKKKNPFLK